jgi:peptide/nickel transport system ATP-binding protein
MSPLLSVENLHYAYRQSQGFLKAKKKNLAVSDVSFQLNAGETLGLVGESGCGKSTLGRVLLNLLPCDQGKITFDGVRIDNLSMKAMRPLRQKMQMVFQDPMESFNNRHTIDMILQEPLQIHRIGDPLVRAKKIRYMLGKVGLSESVLWRYPHELSGGQRQRVALARALMLSPKLLICDESVSALDVSVQAQILNLLVDLQKEFNLAMIFISHDLSVVRHISDRIAVMYLGKWVEMGNASSIIQTALHPYTKILCSAIPIRSPKYRHQIASFNLSFNEHSRSFSTIGCHFSSRCSYAKDKCQCISPVMSGDEHQVACHFPIESGQQMIVNE